MNRSIRFPLPFPEVLLLLPTCEVIDADRVCRSLGFDFGNGESVGVGIAGDAERSRELRLGAGAGADSGGGCGGSGMGDRVARLRECDRRQRRGFDSEGAEGPASAWGELRPLMKCPCFAGIDTSPGAFVSVTLTGGALRSCVGDSGSVNESSKFPWVLACTRSKEVSGGAGGRPGPSCVSCNSTSADDEF